MRHSEVSPAEGAADELSRNALASLTRNSEMLDLLVAALLPLLASRNNVWQEPGQNGAAEGSSPGERESEIAGALPGHQTHGDLPVFDAQEVVAMVDSFNVDRFYRDILHALSEHAQRGGTAWGAAVVVKRVGRDYGLAVAEQAPLPRPTRAEREQAAWERSDKRSR